MAGRLEMRTLLAARQLSPVPGVERHRAVRLRPSRSEAAADRADPGSRPMRFVRWYVNRALSWSGMPGWYEEAEAP